MLNIIPNILKSFLGDYKDHNESSGQMSFNCPACAEEKGMSDGDGKYKLAVNYKKGIFKCWVCAYENNMYGKLSRLIVRFGNKKLLREYLLLKPEDDYDKSKLVPTKVTLPKGFKKLSESSISDYKYKDAYNYLVNRGFTDDMIEYYNIGYTVLDKYKFRVIIPSYDEVGELNFFVGRAWDNWVRYKYLNPDAEKQLIIFNEDKINWDATLYLVEGVFDHIVIPNSIPLLGKTISEKLRGLLYKNTKADIVILLDDDAQEDAIRLYKSLNIGDLYNRVKMCTPPPNHDPSSIFEKWGSDGIVRLLKTSRRLLESKIY
tara:strand:- start:2573 stop:3523 length:951 start_codon:yes stop_codon:yes gene_type:complete